MAINNPTVKAAGDIGINASGSNISKLSDQIFGVIDNVAKRYWEQQALYQQSRGKPLYVPQDLATSAGVSTLSMGLIIGGGLALGLAYILFKGGGRGFTGARRAYRRYSRR